VSPVLITPSDPADHVTDPGRSRPPIPVITMPIRVITMDRSR